MSERDQRRDKRDKGGKRVRDTIEREQEEKEREDNNFAYYYHYQLNYVDNNLIFHIYIIIRKYYHTYFELIHVFYSWFWNNAE